MFKDTITGKYDIMGIIICILLSIAITVLLATAILGQISLETEKTILPSSKFQDKDYNQFSFEEIYDSFNGNAIAQEYNEKEKFVLKDISILKINTDEIVFGSNQKSVNASYYNNDGGLLRKLKKLKTGDKADVLVKINKYSGSDLSFHLYDIR